MDGRDRMAARGRALTVHTPVAIPEGLCRTTRRGTFIWGGDDLLNERIEGANAARYAVVDGEVLSEKRGASRYRFVPDPLGSVRALLDTSGSITATRDYWPYGEVAAQSGGMTAIQYVGALGYFTDTTNRVYVRARHYRPDLGRWVTVDPIGPVGPRCSPYAYSRLTPTSRVDATGLYPQTPGCTPGSADAIGLACACPDRARPYLDSINAIRSWVRCKPITAGQLKCLGDRCNDACTVVRCIDTRSWSCWCSAACRRCSRAEPDGSLPCGFVDRNQIGRLCPTMYLCYPRHQMPGCYGGLWGDLGSPTACTLLHELVHVCVNFTGPNAEECTHRLEQTLTSMCGV